MRGALLAVALATVACGKPCQELAKAVCARATDVCEDFRARAKRAQDAEQTRCQEELGRIDAVIADQRYKRLILGHFRGLGETTSPGGGR